ncbi:hypothetical protein Y032_0272g953 [Ancylostoma ceylanicum]|uniref:Uncharacterized protein n=1 Tax=Ancylostoma ceylanicum TaxID=53326 RepID=A0A016S898_9BILA|nr:hypothetical protein Y032_0272g953 [Ancylostoma ceylanicum]
MRKRKGSGGGRIWPAKGGWPGPRRNSTSYHDKSHRVYPPGVYVSWQRYSTHLQVSQVLPCVYISLAVLAD